MGELLLERLLLYFITLLVVDMWFKQRKIYDKCKEIFSKITVDFRDK